jgi:soluble lytic murein transglycosylase
MTETPVASITQRVQRRHVPRLFAWLTLVLLVFGASAAAGMPDPRTRFQQAWDAAARGDRPTFERLGQGLNSYLLYPYYRYEDYRHHRNRVPPAEMAVFLEQHRDWAFAEGLRQAWLRSLGEHGQWQALLDHALSPLDTENRCFLVRARIERGLTEGLAAEVQALWAVGKSQPDACDPAFDWLRKRGGITPALAWQRIDNAMQAGNIRFTRYLERFVPAAERVWVNRWQDLSRAGYRGLERADAWPDEPIPRLIAASSLRRLAHSDAERAITVFKRLQGHFDWSPAERGRVQRDIALQAAVALNDDALSVLAAVPAEQRDSQLLEWWARTALAQSEWTMLEDVIGQMPADTRQDGRWRYWRGIALREAGDDQAARAILEPLSREATYHGFLAADVLQEPYTICPREPEFDTGQVAALRQRPDFARALELRAAELHDWAASEWQLAAGRLETEDLRTAAALAREEGWHDRVIFALGNSGDLRYYEWRFPVLWAEAVEREASRSQLDKAWILGVMRSESALSRHARSSKGALGLMQVTPATARRLARQHGLPYSGYSQLRQSEPNIRFGTVYMRELLDRYDQNPVLVASAYNAGPRAVDRWLRQRPVDNIAAWVETIPYYETRDYIPRVLAFTTIYDWRLGGPVARVSSRMPAFDSGTIKQPETAQVVCLASG